MINPILEFSVRQRMLVILGSIVVTGFGVLALQADSDRRLSRCDQRAGAGARDGRWDVAARSGKTRHPPA